MDRWRWLVVGVIVTGLVGVVAVRLGDRNEESPEPVSVAVGAEAILCADFHAVPAEASSEGLQSGPSAEIEQDPRCDEPAATPAQGEVVLPRHPEADAAVGNVVLAGELGFDPQQRCFYVVAGDESVGVVWPARFIGQADPPRITDEGGATIVAAGDRFEVRGRYVAGAGDECGPVGAASTGFIAGGDVILTGG